MATNLLKPLVLQFPSAIICEQMPAIFKEDITYIQVENSAVASGLLRIIFLASLQRN